MKNILVTGGAGYIGSHTCKALAKAGYQPIVFDNLSRGFQHALKWGKFVQGDLANEELIFSTLSQNQISAVIHFAAFAYVGESTAQPAMYYKNNTVGTLNLLSAMTRANVKKIVFSSTCATYGIPDAIPISENHPQRPINPYGWSKFMSERMIIDAKQSSGLDFIILRYFNAAGADPDGEIGENHEPETHLIPLAVKAALGGTKLQVFGNDYPTLDGSCVRDYIHVSDLADAHILALEKLNANEGSKIINLGNGNGYSVFEVIKKVEEITQKKIHFEIKNRRLGDPPTLVANAALAKRELGWKPAFQDLDMIVKHAVHWEMKLK